jgi:LAO/AO transport system kinase
VKTVATQGDGIDELVEKIDHAFQFFRNSEARTLKRKEAEQQRLMKLLEERLITAAVQQAFPNGELSKIVTEIAERRQDPYSVVEKIIGNLRFQRLKNS